MPQATWLFVGDSITENWLEAGEREWRRHFMHTSINVGVAGDRTQNILWRLQNGHLPAENCPSLQWAVVLAGTNNLSDGDGPADIARGVGGIVNHILVHCPNARVLLMGVLPRAGARMQAAIREINVRLAQLEDRRRIFYLDIGHRFLKPDGTPDLRLMPDGLHLSAEGYRIWREAILPILAGSPPATAP